MLVLWTDLFIYLLLVLFIVSGISFYRSPLFRKKWNQVLNQPLQLAAVMILAFYFCIGLLDSIHWYHTSDKARENTSNVVSLLDKILSPLPWEMEDSYSAPFACYALGKEAVVSPNGEVKWTYPRLRYGGAHLASSLAKTQDIFNKFLFVLLKTVIWISIVSFLLLNGVKRAHPQPAFFKKILLGKTQFPWRTFLGVFTFFSFLFFLIRDFSSYYHILGTDQIGRDVLYQALKSIRTALVIGLLTTLLMLPFALFFGIVAGFFGGWIDDVVQYIYTTLSSIPGVLLIAASVLSLQMVLERHDWFHTLLERADARLLALCAILGLTSWTNLCRLLRAQALKMRQMDFVQAAYGLGASSKRIIIKHLLPNMLPIILISITLDFSGLVLAEAILSYVGVGVDPSSWSFGTMINAARLEMARLPIVWWCLGSALFLMLFLVLAANVLSDGVREVFSPRD